MPPSRAVHYRQGLGHSPSPYTDFEVPVHRGNNDLKHTTNSANCIENAVRCFIYLFTNVCGVVRMLLSSETMQLYDRARVFLDEDFTAVEKFTVSRFLFQYLAL